MEIKSLYSCGDSFMSVDWPAGTVTSFLQLYANKKNFKHVSLARPGATNYVIRLQIDQAIREQADYVIIGATSCDRFDIPVQPDPFNPDLELKDIHYHGYRAVSENNVNANKPKIVSDVEYNIMHARHQNLISKIQQQALQHYVADLYSPSVQRHKDMYMIKDGLHELSRHNIPFVFLPASMSMNNWTQFKTIWPACVIEPYAMLQHREPYDYNLTVTHNDQSCHNSFCETLIDITQHWS